MVEISMSSEELRKNKIFVASPMYSGMCHGLYTKSILDLQAMLNFYGVENRFSFLFNESLITRARNYLVDEFLRAENFTHLLFIDSDIGFEARDILALIALDKDIIGGPYPKKSINWRNVIEAVKNRENQKREAIRKAEAAESVPDITGGECEDVAGDYVFNAVPGTVKFQVNEPLEVMEIGTGYMMVKRDVFVKFKDEYPHLRYRPDHAGQANFDGSRYIHAYFDTVIDPDSHRYLSEDYMFCQYWRAIGGKVWLCPWFKSTHTGTFGFKGNMEQIAKLTGRI